MKKPLNRDISNLKKQNKGINIYEEPLKAFSNIEFFKKSKNKNLNNLNYNNLNELNLEKNIKDNKFNKTVTNINHTFYKNYKNMNLKTICSPFQKKLMIFKNITELNINKNKKHKNTSNQKDYKDNYLKENFINKNLINEENKDNNKYFKERNEFKKDIKLKGFIKRINYKNEEYELSKTEESNEDGNKMGKEEDNKINKEEKIEKYITLKDEDNSRENKNRKKEKNYKSKNKKKHHKEGEYENCKELLLSDIKRTDKYKTLVEEEEEEVEEEDKEEILNKHNKEIEKKNKYSTESDNAIDEDDSSKNIEKEEKNEIKEDESGSQYKKKENFPLMKKNKKIKNKKNEKEKIKKEKKEELELKIKSLEEYKSDISLEKEGQKKESFISYLAPLNKNSNNYNPLINKNSKDIYNKEFFDCQNYKDIMRKFNGKAGKFNLFLNKAFSNHFLFKDKNIIYQINSNSNSKEDLINNTFENSKRFSKENLSINTHSLRNKFFSTKSSFSNNVLVNIINTSSIKKKNYLKKNYSQNNKLLIVKTESNSNLQNKNRFTLEKGYETINIKMNTINSPKCSEKNKIINFLNDPKIPYSTNWANKFLNVNYNKGLQYTDLEKGVPQLKIKKLKKKNLPPLYQRNKYKNDEKLISHTFSSGFISNRNKKFKTEYNEIYDYSNNSKSKRELNTKDRVKIHRNNSESNYKSIKLIDTNKLKDLRKKNLSKIYEEEN